MSLPYGTIYANFGMEKAVSTTQDHAMGTRMVLPDGRIFRYVENGATATVAGRLYQSEVPDAQHDSLVVAAAAAVGAQSISVTLGTVAVTANEYNEGYLNIEDDAGEGRLYSITDHAAAAVSASLTVPIADEGGIREALTTASTVGLVRNIYRDIIIHPSPPTAVLVGVAVSDIAANGFGWVQTWGPCSVLNDTTIPVISSGVTASSTVDGAVTPLDMSGTNPLEIIVGYTIEVAPVGECSIINLVLSP